MPFFNLSLKYYEDRNSRIFYCDAKINNFLIFNTFFYFLFFFVIFIIQ